MTYGVVYVTYGVVHETYGVVYVTYGVVKVETSWLEGWRASKTRTVMANQGNLWVVVMSGKLKEV